MPVVHVFGYHTFLIYRNDYMPGIDHIIRSTNGNMEQMPIKVLILCLCNVVMHWLSNWCYHSRHQLQRVSGLASQQPLKQIAEHVCSRLHFATCALKRQVKGVTEDCLRVWLQVLLPATSDEVPILIGIKLVATYPQALHGTSR